MGGLPGREIMLRYNIATRRLRSACQAEMRRVALPRGQAEAAASSRRRASASPISGSSACHVGAVVAPGQRLAQRQEQRLALAPGRLLERGGQRAPRVVAPVDRSSAPRLRRDRRASRRRTPAARPGRSTTLPPVGRLGDASRGSAGSPPSRLAHARRAAARRRASNGSWWTIARVEPRQLGLVEPRRRAAEAGEIEGLDQRVARRRSARPARRCRSARAARRSASGSIPASRKRVDAERAEPLRQLALAADQQRLVREARRRGARARRTSGSAARCSRHGPRRAAHGSRPSRYRRPRSAACRATSRRRGGPPGRCSCAGSKCCGPRMQVVPFDRRVVIELEAPVRRDALGLERRALGLAQRQRRAVVDRRQPAPELRPCA